MELIGIVILIAVVGAFSAIPLCIFNSDARRVAGTSTYTNVLLYRKLVNENKLTRMQIRTLERQRIQSQCIETIARLRRWEESQDDFRIRLERARQSL